MTVYVKITTVYDRGDCNTYLDYVWLTRSIWLIIGARNEEKIMVIVIVVIIVIILFYFKSRKLDSLYAWNISDIEQVSIVSGGTGDIAVVRNAEDIEKLAQYFGECKLQPDYFYSDSKQAGVTG